MSPSIAKKTKKSLTLEVKLDIIHRHKRGEKTNRLLATILTRSTVSTVFKSADSIKKAGESRGEAGLPTEHTVCSEVIKTDRL
ncbi:hypothetical protein E2C01_078901 [Portunus trituberculatus]|uniref:HTH psq-type domain-containing protein n=1 Tax=Portunus trituberculatus TaxID=210409 RepID=A0A5B7IP28_PORTR|nr:hypothetical protein [Portunus trituberculatus]